MDPQMQQILDSISSIEEEIASMKKYIQASRVTSDIVSQHEESVDPVDTQKQTNKSSNLEEGDNDDPEGREDSKSTEEEAENIPLIGRQGYFDGVFMIGDIEDKKFQVPPNYVSKSLLVVGDRLEIVDVDETGSKYFFKQLDHVERKEVTGILTKKNNQWSVLTPDNKTYYVVAAAIKYYGGEIGDKAVIILPNQEVPVENIEWAALKELHKSDGQIKGPATNSDETPVTQSAQPEVSTDKSLNTVATTNNTQSTQQQPKSQPQQLVNQVVSHPQAAMSAPVQTGTPDTLTQAKPAFDTKLPVQSQPQANPSQQTESSSANMQGEVTVSSDTGENSAAIGEVDLTEEQLWELR